ncbi:MAG: ABC transporter substrate-binding protein [Acetobacteraceae bacterium]
MALGVTLSALAAMPAGAEPFKCPRVGGSFTFGQEANVNSLDQMTSNTISTRNIAMNIFEALTTRDENNNPILDLADSLTEAPDRMSYTFKLRPGVTFHNGKPMTATDVAASWDRYAKVGLDRQVFDPVAKWEAVDPMTFVVTMKAPSPTFVEKLSSFSIPIVIVPAEAKDDPPQQLRTIGTGPWQLAQSVPGSFVALKRFEAYAPNPHFEQRTGFGGYKQACFDQVTFRIVTEGGARVAGLETGELQAVEDVPTKSLDRLKANKDVRLLPLVNWWIQIALGNASNPPTDDVRVRQAIQAVLDMDEIMDAATDGNYKLNYGFAYPNQPDYVTTGEKTYNQKDPAKAKRLLTDAGYKGQPIVLLTNKDYSSMYNAALVVQEQLKAVGINAELKVVDWPTSAQMSQKADSGWNLYFTGWGTQPALGALATMAFLAPPGAQYKPKDDKDDPDVLAAWRDMNNLPSKEERKAAFGRMQGVLLERAYVFPFGALTKVQATRANVEGWKPFRIPRVSNVWFAN